MLKFLDRMSRLLTDVRNIGPGFVARHLRPWASEHTFTYAGKPVTIRRKGTDARIVQYLLRDREYEFPEPVEKRVRARYDAILSEGKKPLIIDGGGNIGTTAIYFSLKFPEALIVSIELESENSSYLRKNTAPWPNITAIDAALGGKPGSTGFGGTESWGFFASGEGAIPVVTVSEIVSRYPGTELLIVKLDIEGGEESVFADGADLSWLDRTESLIIEPHDWCKPGTSRGFQAAMGARDFDLFIQHNNLFYVRRR